MYACRYPFTVAAPRGGGGNCPPPPMIFFLACQLSGRSSAMKIPLPHYEDFLETFLKSENKCVRVPPPPPPLSDFFQGWCKFFGLAHSVARHFAPPPLSKHPGAAPAPSWFNQFFLFEDGYLNQNRVANQSFLSPKVW